MPIRVKTRSEIGCEMLLSGLLQLQTKWTPVRMRKIRQFNKLERRSDSVGAALARIGNECNVRGWLGILSVLLLPGCAEPASPVSGAEIARFTAQLNDQIITGALPPGDTLTLEEAVARAVHFNHEVRAKQFEALLAQAEARRQAGAMLPDIIAEIDFFGRDQPAQSRSSLATTYSTSSEAQGVARDITLSWNILDFGLSVIRTRQGLDKVYQQQEGTRRVRARIAEETRSLYWRAAALLRLQPAMAKLQPEINAALALSRRALKDERLEPLLAIDYQRQLLGLQRDADALRASLAGSLAELKQSISAPEPAQLNLASAPVPTRHQSPPGTVLANDIRKALQQRPEIRQHMYDMRITESEVDASLLKLLPGVSLSAAVNTDSNQFLLHSQWLSWGSRIASNAIELVRLPAELDSIDAQQQVNRQNALATAAMIAMQVSVARARLGVQRAAYRDAERLATAQRLLYGQVRTAVELGKLGRQALVREKLALLLADIRTLLAFADVDAAAAAYATALGDDPVGTFSAAHTGSDRQIRLAARE